MESLKAKDYMQTRPITFSAEMMMGQKPKIYPVVEEGHLLGVISRHDVMQAIHAQLGACFVRKARA